MRINSTTWKLFAHACSDGAGALVFGLCLVLTIKHFDSLYITITMLFGVALIADLFWMRREVRPGVSFWGRVTRKNQYRGVSARADWMTGKAQTANFGGRNVGQFLGPAIGIPGDTETHLGWPSQ